MKIAMKKSISIMMLFVLFMGVMVNGNLTLKVKAATTSASGSCGTSATYTFDSATGKLTITGTGKIADDAFIDHTDIKKVEIQDGITDIGEDAFWGCSSLESVVIPDSVTTIGRFAFWQCSSLESVVIPDSVTTIKKYTFRECSSLENVVIGKSVNSIDDGAFYYCNNLTTITFMGDTPPATIHNYAFLNSTNISVINVPYGASAAYTSVLSGVYDISSITPTEAPKPAAPGNGSSSSNSNSDSKHSHTLVWKTTKEPTMDSDGVTSLICSSCGHVESTQTISRAGVVYMSYANTLESKFKTAKAGDVIKLDLGDWHSVPKYLMERIITSKNDVEITYKYKGKTYDIIVPAGKGVDLKIDWYGPLLMNSIYGR